MSDYGTVAAGLAETLCTLGESRYGVPRSELPFQALVEEVRFAHAVEYLTKTEDAIERVAERLGYVDPSNFRCAFRRWAGFSPAAFRAGWPRKRLEKKVSRCPAAISLARAFK